MQLVCLYVPQQPGLLERIRPGWKLQLLSKSCLQHKWIQSVLITDNESIQACRQHQRLSSCGAQIRQLAKRIWFASGFKFRATCIASDLAAKTQGLSFLITSPGSPSYLPSRTTMGH